jgi:hypothetical protein
MLNVDLAEGRLGVLNRWLDVDLGMARKVDLIAVTTGGMIAWWFAVVGMVTDMAFRWVRLTWLTLTMPSLTTQMLTFLPALERGMCGSTMPGFSGVVSGTDEDSGMWRIAVMAAATTMDLTAAAVDLKVDTDLNMDVVKPATVLQG